MAVARLKAEGPLTHCVDVGSGRVRCVPCGNDERSDNVDPWKLRRPTCRALLLLRLLIYTFSR